MSKSYMLMSKFQLKCCFLNYTDLYEYILYGVNDGRKVLYDEK